MNIKRIEKYLIKEHNELIKIGPYWIPEIIYTPRSPTKYLNLSIYKGRDVSEYEENFENWIKSKYFKEQYISEFPIPIFDRDLWIEICKDREIIEDEITGKSIIFLDFFFLYRGLAIEIDGSQHWINLTQKKSDEVRDLYLQEKYNLPTLRLPQFINTTEDIFENYLIRTGEFRFKNWNRDIIKSWIFSNKEIIELIDIVECNFKDNVEIILSRDEIYDLKMGYLFYLNLKNFNEILFKFNKKKIIIPSNP